MAEQKKNKGTTDVPDEFLKWHDEAKQFNKTPPPPDARRLEPGDGTDEKAQPLPNYDSPVFKIKPRKNPRNRKNEI